MTQKELITAVSGKTALSKHATSTVLDALFETMIETLATGEKVQLTNFGTFTVKNRPERDGFNPYAMQHIVIPAKRTVFFRPSRTLRDIANKT